VQTKPTTWCNIRHIITVVAIPSALQPKRLGINTPTVARAVQISLFGNIAAATESGAKAHITVVATSAALHPIL
jgi:hypothetical protein